MNNGLSRFYYALAIGVIILGALYFCKPVLMPIALSVLLAFILNPLVRVFEGWRLGRIASVLLASFMAFAIIGFSTWALADQIQRLAVELPSHTHEIKAKIDSFKSSGNSTIGRLTKMLEEVFPNGPEQNALPTNSNVVGFDGNENGLPPIDDKTTEKKLPMVVVAEPANSRIQAAVETLLPVVEPLATVALVVVLVLFLLLRREDMRYRVISLLGDNALTGTTRLMRDTAERVSSYLLNLLMVNAAFGLWFSAGLYFLGVPYAPLWGALTLFLRFIPFLGSPASVLFPLLISVATSTGWWQPVALLIFFAISELVTANVIEPILFGKTTGLTPIALLIAALFWAWIWGPLGLLLSTPLTVCLVVLGQHIPQLRSLKVLLAEQPVLESRMQYFQRLLAQDKIEARRVVEQYASEFGQEKTFDDVVVPALRWTRRERTKEIIDANEEELIWQTNNEILSELKQYRIAEAETKPTDQTEVATEPVPNNEQRPAGVYGYPVHHPSEEIALEMLGELLADISIMKTCKTQILPSKAIDEIQALRPAAVVLAVMPPGGLPQANFMCNELAKKCPGTQTVVMYLKRIEDYDTLLVNLRKAGASYLTTSLAQTRTQLTAIIAEFNVAGQGLGDQEPPTLSDADTLDATSKPKHHSIDAADEVEYVE